MSATLEIKITAPIPTALDERLERIAKATGLKKSLLIRAALERQLPEIERNGITFPATNKLTDQPQALETDPIKGGLQV